jgi:Uma2 family endonuclease
MLAVKERKHTIRDYQTLPEGSPFQLVGGELVKTPAPNPRHQIISAKLFKRISNFVDREAIGITLYSPIDVYLDDGNAFQPDIVVILNENKGIIKDDGIYGPPDIVIEILSPSTAYYDLKKKFKVYEKAGVTEYWIVDPEVNTIEIYANEEKRFILKANSEEQGKVESAVLNGFKLTVAEVF